MRAPMRGTQRDHDARHGRQAPRSGRQGALPQDMAWPHLVCPGDAIAVDLLGADENHAGVREAVQATLVLARGLALANQLTDDSRRRARIVRQWATMLDRALRDGKSPDACANARHPT